MEDFGSLFSVSALEWYDCVQQERVSRSAKRRLESLLYVEDFGARLRVGAKNSPVYSVVAFLHHCSLPVPH